MDNKEFLNSFRQTVFEYDGDFTLVTPGVASQSSTFQFMQCRIGIAKYVFGYESQNVRHSIDNKPKLLAIVSNENLFIVDEFFFGLSLTTKSELQLPDRAFIFSQIVDACNEYVTTVAFPKIYDELEACETPVYPDLVSEARLISLSEKYRLRYEELKMNAIYSLLTQDDVASILCGFTSLQKLATEVLYDISDALSEQKSRDVHLLRLISQGSVCKPWEEKMAIAANLDVKFITVEFERNGVHAIGKINPKALLRRLVHEETFSKLDFQSGKMGTKIFAQFGLNERCSTNCLRCSDISEISFNKRILYTKQF